MNLLPHKPSKELLDFLCAPQINKKQKSLNSEEPIQSKNEIEHMLSFLDPDMGYYDWLQVGMGLHASGYSLDVWDNWSKGGSKYVGGECKQKWASFEHKGGITAATICRMAKQAGYKPKLKNFAANNAEPIHELKFNRKFTSGSEVEIAKNFLEDLKQLHGEIVFCEGRYWHFTGKIWQELLTDNIRTELYKYDGILYGTKSKRINLSSRKIDGIMNELSYLCKDESYFITAATGINCNSGFITFDHNGHASINRHKSNHKQRFLISANWPSQNNNKIYFEKLIDGCFFGDQDKEQKFALISELMGAACLSYATQLKSPKAIIFLGESANNGKSQVLKLIRGLLPAQAKVAIAPEHFEKDIYKIMLRGKALNTCDELNAKAISSDNFKLIITGDELTGRDHYKQPESFIPKALHIFATNILPPFTSGIDRGVMRRLLVLRFNRSIPKEEVIENIAQKILDNEMDCLLDCAVEGAQKLIQNGMYIEPESSKEILRDWLLDADPVRSWVGHRTEFGNYETEHKNAYFDFKLYAEQEGYRNIPAANLFSQRLRSIVPNFNRKRHSHGRVYIGFKLKP